TLMAQTRLRPGDLLARSGGDEFCIVLPASTLHEGAIIARRVLEVCRRDAEGCAGTEIPIEVSIGIAQWNSQTRTAPGTAHSCCRQCALYRQEGRQEPLFGIRALATARARRKCDAGTCVALKRAECSIRNNPRDCSGHDLPQARDGD